MAENVDYDLSGARKDWLDNWVDNVLKFIEDLGSDRTKEALLVENVYVPKGSSTLSPQDMLNSASKVVSGGGKVRVNRLFGDVKAVDRTLVLIQAFSGKLLELSDAGEDKAYTALLGFDAKKRRFIGYRRVSSLGSVVRAFQHSLSREVDMMLSQLEKSIKAKKMHGVVEFLTYFLGSSAVSKHFVSERSGGNVVGLLEVGDMNPSFGRVGWEKHAEHPENLNDFHFSLFFYSRAVRNLCVNRLAEYSKETNVEKKDSILKAVHGILSERVRTRIG